MALKEATAARTATLMRHAIRLSNEAVREDKNERKRARRKLEQMVADQKRAHEEWQEEQDRRANEGGLLAGLLQGAATGASIGGMFGGVGALVGGAVGGLGGAIFGGTQGREAVAQVSPYAGAITGVAGTIGAYQAGQPREAATQATQAPPTTGGPGGLQLTMPELGGGYGGGGGYGLGEAPSLQLDTGFMDSGLGTSASMGGPTRFAESVRGGAVGTAQHRFLDGSKANQLPALLPLDFKSPNVGIVQEAFGQTGLSPGGSAYGVYNRLINRPVGLPPKLYPPQGYTGMPAEYLREPPGYYGQ